MTVTIIAVMAGIVAMIAITVDMVTEAIAIMTK
jgi:hypothetical protein